MYQQPYPPVYGAPPGPAPGGGHSTYYPQAYHPATYQFGYGGVDLWPQLRPRLRELMTQFNKDQKTSEQACRAAQELVRGLHSPSELQAVVSELLYDMKRQHPQIRKLRFRVASSAVQENASHVVSGLVDSVVRQMVASVDTERQANLQEQSNLLQALGRAMVVRGPAGAAGGKGGASSDEDNYLAINNELIAPLMKVAVSTPGSAGKPKASAACFLLNNVLSEVLKSSVPRHVMPLSQEVMKNMLDMMNTGFLSLEVIEVFFIIRQLAEVLGPDIPSPLVRKLVKTCMKAVKGRGDGPWQCRRQAIKTISSLINTMQVCIQTDFPDLEFGMSPAGQELMHLKPSLVQFFDECRFDKSMQVKDEANHAKNELNLIPERDLDLD